MAKKVASKKQSKLIDFARRLRQYRDRKEALEGELKDLEKEMKDFNFQFVQLMENNDLQKFSVDDVGTCYIEASIFPKVIDEPKLFSFLRAKGLGAIIKETIHPSTLKSTTKEYLEQNNRVPDGLEVTTVAKVRIRAK